MTCSICGGYVTWQGPLSNLTHTQCLKCGGTNCQVPDPQPDEEDSVAGPSAEQCNEILGRHHYE